MRVVKSICITKRQEEFIENKCLNLSKFLQHAIDSEMERDKK